MSVRCICSLPGTTRAILVRADWWYHRPPEVNHIKAFLKNFLLLLILGLWGSLDITLAQTNHGDIVVLGKKWHYEAPNRIRGEDRNYEKEARESMDRRLGKKPPPAQGLPPLPTAASPTGIADNSSLRRPLGDFYIYEATVRNGGKKSVVSITWQYIFSEPTTGKQLGSRRFETMVLIRPGKTGKLVGRSGLPPTDTVDISQLGTARYVETIEIISVLYKDGSRD